MKSDILTSKNNGVEIEREDFIHLLTQAVDSGNLRFIKQAAGNWLEKYPNDLMVQLFVAKSLFLEKELSKTNEILNYLCERDPEFLDAWDLRLQVAKRVDPQSVPVTVAYIYALGGEISEGFEIPRWSKLAKELISSLKKDDSGNDQSRIDELIKENPNEVLTAILHLQHVRKEKDALSYLQLGKIYHQRWPKCLQIVLLLAEAQIENSEESDAVKSFHNCSSQDPAGQVPERLWGKNHEYSSIWPQNLKFQLSIPIPAQIAIPLGWNQLLGGKESIHPKKSAEKSKWKLIFKKREEKKVKVSSIDKKTRDLNDEEEDFNKISEKFGKPELKDLDGRFPVYVVLSTKKGLINKFGEKSAEVVVENIMNLVETLNLRPGWKSLAYFPDDINCARLYEIDPILEIDPWKIKLALVDLDKFLGKKGQMIGCVLIVGGHDIIPFHALPNPTNDKDKEVLSDNPYATLDSNYFIPEWPIGRLPVENDNDPGLLLKQLRQIIQYHLKQYRKIPWWQALFNLLITQNNINSLISSFFSKVDNYGYTASVWRRSSIASFRPIGSGNYLRVSPPYNSKTLDIDKLLMAKYVYFNLHGLPDTADWYGQRDLSEAADGPDFPIAISANQFVESKNHINVVFSEACYGAYIQEKNINGSIALSLMDIGLSTFIGSTGIAYGSVNTPLIGADLIAFLFWNYVNEGYPVGEAFLQAKLGLANMMTQRQGYLDGDDQKTLISFILLGDPLAAPYENRRNPRTSIRQKQVSKLNTYNDQNGVSNTEPRISGEILDKLKTTLKDYLPGLENAELSIRQHQVIVNKASADKAGGSAGKTNNLLANRFFLTYYKSLEIKNRTHLQYARVTLDEQGKMLKLAVSR